MYEVFLKQAGERGRWVAVATLAEASAAVRRFVAAGDSGHGMGFSEFEGGKVRRAGESRSFARVSYNGRVWDAAGAEIKD